MKKNTVKMKIICCDTCGNPNGLGYTKDKRIHMICLFCGEDKQDFGNVLEFTGIEKSV